MQAIALFAAKAFSVIGSAVGAGGGAAAAAGGHAAAAAGGTALAAANGAAAAGASAGGLAALGGHAASGASALMTAGNGAAAGGSTLLAGLRLGTSMISGLSNFSMGRAQDEAAKAEAFDETLASRQEYTQAAEKSAEIQRRYNRSVEDQLAVASASGIDLGSGSILAARERSGEERDRALTITRNNAQLTAALRRGRAAALRASGGSAKTAGAVSGVANVGMKLLEMAGGR